VQSRIITLNANSSALGTDLAKKEIISTTLAVIGVVSKTYDVVKKIFASSTKTEIVKKYTNLGFDAYSKRTLVMSFIGVELSKGMAFKEYLLRILKLT
jgi:hypothetical protein